MATFKTIEVKTPSREVLVDVTGRVQSVVAHAVDHEGLQEGLCRVYVPHTTAGVTINENADPAVKQDLVTILRALVPRKDSYKHAEGNSDAHAKATLVGSAVAVPVHAGALVLGTWQGIMFCEFDGPRTRKVHVQVTGA